MTGAGGQIKRFYRAVDINAVEGGFEIRLDARPLRTKRRRTLLAPNAALATAIKTEWDDQGEHIDPATTPLTNLLTEALDGDAAEQWRDDIMSYLTTDLICYRAEAPKALVERQAAAWDPYLDWLRDDFGSALVVTAGVIATPQPDIAIDRIRNFLAPMASVSLAALRKATAITGSAAMALALWEKKFAAMDIFEASIVDDRFQAEKWGEDDEAAARRDALRAEFLTVARFLELTHPN